VAQGISKRGTLYGGSFGSLYLAAFDIFRIALTPRSYCSVRIWTKGLNPDMKVHVPRCCRDLPYIAQVGDVEPWSLDDLIVAIKDTASSHARKAGRPGDNYTIAACIAGGEVGVDMASMLSERLGMLSNRTHGDFANRRNKKVQVTRSWSVCNFPSFRVW